MSLIRVTNLTFEYEGSYDPIFENVSFQIDTDWKLGFTGRNGRGKTTFLRLLMGQYEYQGTISASVAFDYFPFEVTDYGMDTLELVEEILPDYEYWKLSRELSLLELEEDVLYRPFGTLSNGEQTKVMLAVLFLRENHFLLIDEPTNHLDLHAREVVSAYLDKKKGFILVSHDRAFLDRCIDHILSINKTNIEIQQGNFSSWRQNMEYQTNYELAENEKLKKEIRHLTEASRRSAGWSDAVEKTKYGTRNSGLRPDRGFIGHKAEKMMKRAKAAEARREKAAEDKAGLLKNVEKAPELILRPLPHHSRRLMEASGIEIAYSQKQVCGPLDFTINAGDRIALTGRNGAGKSSILKLLAGYEIPHRGQLTEANGLIISYVEQDTSFLKGELADFVEQNNLDETLFKAVLRKLDFSRGQFEKRIESFSAGQKKKILLAKSLCTPAHLYIWDEPLNYIDVLSRIQLEELILKFKPTMILVEHDKTFLDHTATGSISLDR